MLDQDKLKKDLEELINYAEIGDQDEIDRIKTKILEEYSNKSEPEINLSWGGNVTKKEKLSGPFHVAYRKMLPGDPHDKEGYGKNLKI